MQRFRNGRGAVAVCLTAAAGVLLTLTACGGGNASESNGTSSKESSSTETTPPPGQPGAVGMKDVVFVPQTITVPAGTKVTWTNDEELVHTVKDTSPLMTPESPTMNKGDTFSITYEKPGTYPYVCSIHPAMTGSVEVR